MRISDWSSDVCSSDLTGHVRRHSVSPARCCDHDVDIYVGDDLGIGTLTANIELVEIAGLSHRDKVAVGDGVIATDLSDVLMMIDLRESDRFCTISLSENFIHRKRLVLGKRVVCRFVPLVLRIIKKT